MTRVLADHAEILSMRQKIQQLEAEKAEQSDIIKMLRADLIIAEEEKTELIGSLFLALNDKKRELYIQESTETLRRFMEK